jgi:hypothetical protein
MSFPDAKTAIEKKLALLVGVLPTARENMTYTPISGVAYQRINFLKAPDSNLVKGRKITRISGIAQVTLFYPSPSIAGTTLADAMAEDIKAHFKPVQTLIEGSTKVFITDSPNIATGFPNGDRWVIPVSIQWFADIYG